MQNFYKIIKLYLYKLLFLISLFFILIYSLYLCVNIHWEHDDKIYQLKDLSVCSKLSDFENCLVNSLNNIIDYTKSLSKYKIYHKTQLELTLLKNQKESAQLDRLFKTNANLNNYKLVTVTQMPYLIRIFKFDWVVALHMDNKNLIIYHPVLNVIVLKNDSMILNNNTEKLWFVPKV